MSTYQKVFVSKDITSSFLRTNSQMTLMAIILAIPLLATEAWCSMFVISPLGNHIALAATTVIILLTSIANWKIGFLANVLRYTVQRIIAVIFYCIAVYYSCNEAVSIISHYTAPQKISVQAATVSSTYISHHSHGFSNYTLNLTNGQRFNTYDQNLLKIKGGDHIKLHIHSNSLGSEVTEIDDLTKHINIKAQPWLFG